MNRRTARDRRLVFPPRTAEQKFVSLFSAGYSWSAERVTSAGSTTAFLPLSGGVSLLSAGTAQAAPAASAQLNGRTTVSFSGTGRYQGSIPAPGLNQTLVFAGYLNANNNGLLALTNAGGINSGTAILTDFGTIKGRRLAADAGAAYAPPLKVVVAVVFTAAAGTLYLNARTGITVASAQTGYSFGDVVLGSVAGATYQLTGEVGFAGILPWAASPAEIDIALGYLGPYYGITIGA